MITKNKLLSTTSLLIVIFVISVTWSLFPGVRPKIFAVLCIPLVVMLHLYILRLFVNKDKLFDPPSSECGEGE